MLSILFTDTKLLPQITIITGLIFICMLFILRSFLLLLLQTWLGADGHSGILAVQICCATPPHYTTPPPKVHVSGWGRRRVCFLMSVVTSLCRQGGGCGMIVLLRDVQSVRERSRQELVCCNCKVYCPIYIWVIIIVSHCITVM